MDPLKRKTVGRKQQDHEQRIQQLERRVFPQASAWAFAQLTTDQTIGAGSSAFLEFDTFWTGDQETFYTNTGGAGYTVVQSAEFGVYHAQCVVEWEQVAADYYHAIQLQGSRQIASTFSDFGVSPPTASTVRLDNTVGDLVNLPLVDSLIGVHSPWDYLPTQPAGWQILAFNPGASPVDVTRANMMVVRLPSAEREKDYVVF